jgi:ribonuclease R
MVEDKKQPIKVNEKDLLNFICNAKKPPSFTEIVKRFGLTKNEKKPLKKLLKRLSKEGKIAVRKGRYICPTKEEKKEKPKRVIGTVVAYPAGFGFLQSPELEKDFGYSILKFLTDLRVNILISI